MSTKRKNQIKAKAAVESFLSEATKELGFLTAETIVNISSGYPLSHTNASTSSSLNCNPSTTLI